MLFLRRNYRNLSKLRKTAAQDSTRFAKTSILEQILNSFFLSPGVGGDGGDGKQTQTAKPIL